MQDIESNQNCGRVTTRFCNLRRGPQLRPVLKCVEGRPSIAAENDNLTVKHHRSALGAQIRRDFRKGGRQVNTAARLQPNLRLTHEGDDPVSVELRLIK